MPVERLIRLGATLVYGVAFFFWLGYEDVGAQLAINFGVSGSVLAVWHVVARRWHRQMPAAALRAAQLGGLGLLAGLGGVALTILLMTIKISLHSHDYPDFSLRDVIAVVRWLPVWMIAGGLGGCGLGLMWWGYSLFAEAGNDAQPLSHSPSTNPDTID